MTQPVISSLTVHHISISVADIDVAIGWYDEILGFALHSRFEIASFGAKAAFLRRDSLCIELWQIGRGESASAKRRSPQSDLKEGGTKHVAFLVRDLRNQLLHLSGRGVDIAAVQTDPTEPMNEDKDSFDFMRPVFAAFIRDPSGTLLELIDQQCMSEMGLT